MQVTAAGVTDKNTSHLDKLLAFTSVGAAGFEGPGQAPDLRGSGGVDARDGAGSSDAPREPAAATRGAGATCDPLPSSIPSFLEACAKLASEAAAQHDLERACDLIHKAAKAAALADEPHVLSDGRPLP